MMRRAMMRRARMRRATTRFAMGPLFAVLLALCTTTLPAQAPDSPYIGSRYGKTEVMIPMRDGVRLHTAVYVPRDASPSRRYPIVLQRTPFSAAPYGEGRYPATLGPDRYMTRDGYIFVNQEVRGRYRSEGTFENVRPLLSSAERARTPRATDESTDAYDTIEWLLGNVAGNSGRVGLLGVSYGGYYAGAALVSRHPAVAAASLQAPVTDFFFEDFHHNGALVQGSFYAFPVFGTPRPAPTGENWWLPAYQKVARLGAADDYFTLLGIGALSNVTARFHGNDLLWQELVAHPNYDAFWQARSLPPRLAEITVPVLVVGGWFDAENLYGSIEAYRALRERSPAAPVSLVMGPFGHRDWGAHDQAHTTHGNLYFGDSLAARYQRDIEAPFFRHALKEQGESVPAGAIVFDTGEKEWRTFSSWPARSAVRRDFLLQPGSIGVATSSSPAFVEFTSDPLTPVPGRCAGPTIEDGALNHYMTDDQRCFSSRPDVTVFTSDTLREDVTFAGPITARIVLSTTGTDADVVVKLIDVYPPDEPNHPYMRDTTVRLGGYQQLVRGEIMRGRFRRGFGTPLPFTPDEPTEITFNLPDVFHTFRKGHRLMVQVQGTWFPVFDRNPQRYVPNIFTAQDSDFTAAVHRVWVGGANGSRLQATILP